MFISSLADKMRMYILIASRKLRTRDGQYSLPIDPPPRKPLS
jgi:hypothetical protein